MCWCSFLLTTEHVRGVLWTIISCNIASDSNHLASTKHVNDCDKGRRRCLGWWEHSEHAQSHRWIHSRLGACLRTHTCISIMGNTCDGVYILFPKACLIRAPPTQIIPPACLMGPSGHLRSIYMIYKLSSPLPVYSDFSMHYVQMLACIMS